MNTVKMDKNSLFQVIEVEYFFFRKTLYSVQPKRKANQRLRKRILELEVKSTDQKKSQFYRDFFFISL